MTRSLALRRAGLVRVRDSDHATLPVIARDRVINRRAIVMRDLVMRDLLRLLGKCGAREHGDDAKGRQNQLCV